MPPEVASWQQKPSTYVLPTPSWRYLELETAKEWGLPPGQWDALENMEKAEMMGFLWASRRVESYHYDKAMKAAKVDVDELPGRKGRRP